MNYHKTPLSHFGFDPVEGDVALELEVEGRDLPIINNRIWKTHNDGSLKLGGKEYVHNGPKPITQVRETMLSFVARIKQADATVYETERTSVHTHINVQTLSFKQLTQSAIAYYMIEPALMKIAGKSRMGNLFCLPMQNAPEVLTVVKDLKNGLTGIRSLDSYRYASLNFAAIQKFGSLEVRTMRGVYDPELLSLWANGLHSIIHKAAEMKSPVHVLDSWYGVKPEEFLSQFLSNEFIDLIRSQKDWDSGLSRNHKLLTFVYSEDWDKSKEDFQKEEARFREPTGMSGGDYEYYSRTHRNALLGKIRTSIPRTASPHVWTEVQRKVLEFLPFYFVEYSSTPRYRVIDPSDGQEFVTRNLGEFANKVRQIALGGEFVENLNQWYFEQRMPEMTSGERIE